MLPPAEDIVKAFFIRKEFIPEPLGTSALFPYFAQHFTHMFFKTDLKKGPQFQWGGHGVCNLISFLYHGIVQSYFIKFLPLILKPPWDTSGY